MPDPETLARFTESWVQSEGLPILRKSYAGLWDDIKTFGGPPEAWFAGFRAKGKQVVTAGEVAFERSLRAALAVAFPGQVAVWGEELGDEADVQDKTIAAIDPVDGTASMLASLVWPGAYGFGISVGWMRAGAFWGGQVFVLSGARGQLDITQTWRGFAGGPTTCNGQAVDPPGPDAGPLYCTAPEVMFTEGADQRAFWALERAASEVVTDQNCAGILRAAQEGATAAEADLTIHDVAALVPLLRGASMVVTRFDGAPLEPTGPGDMYTLHTAHAALHAEQQAQMRTARADGDLYIPGSSSLFRRAAAPHARKFNP
ncbi:MAG TPA: hypothetical protein DDX54_02220 [Rhodospirillaceae bacterium]|jgi:fructose-1,6-bisphosphatase/inositol monophosphatase family enzyme|nr:hypothetical protein [Rhodospirillaceae bacterium]